MGWVGAGAKGHIMGPRVYHSGNEFDLKLRIAVYSASRVCNHPPSCRYWTVQAVPVRPSMHSGPIRGVRGCYGTCLSYRHETFPNDLGIRSDQ